ncbi:hypothetical protein GCM10025862_36230 [Arsenicicoccus piscis]|uniref:Nudix hydrolase domain-containing protein n=1 Tax=Arsenicicoccus piscis TaxID=673954 RepID=A0ABQ6HUG3_9MICO|nr:hypothetical protein GCM10025862_36230 [Arsenicicoccus piscis]
MTMPLPSMPPPRSARRLPAVEEVSAGGVIIRVEQGRAELAIIARHNRAGRVEWCLPKGHIEGTETLEQTAVREVAEETGIEGRVLTRLGSIDYWFTTSSARVHKVVHHYLLEATGASSPSRTTPTTRPSTSPGCRCARTRPSSPSPTRDASPRRPGNAWRGTRDRARARLLGRPGAADGAPRSRAGPDRRGGWAARACRRSGRGEHWECPGRGSRAARGLAPVGSPRRRLPGR